MTLDLHPEWDPSQGPLPGDLVIASATTVGDVINKPQLNDWRAEQTARVAWQNFDHLVQLHQAGAEQEFFTWLRDAPYHEYRDGRLNARDRGTLLHAKLEELLGGAPVYDELIPDYLRPHCELLEKWVETTGYRAQFMERFVWRESRGGHPPVGGRFDNMGRFPGDTDLWLLDLKSADDDETPGGRKRRPYPATVTLQLAQYANCDYMANHKVRTIETQGGKRRYLVSEAERDAADAAPRPDRAGIILVTPEAVRFHEINLNEYHTRAALSAAEVHYHQASVKGYMERADKSKGVEL